MVHFIVSMDHVPPARSQSAWLMKSGVDGLADGGLLPRSDGADGIEGAGDGLVDPGALGFGVAVPESVPGVPAGLRVPLPDGA